MVVKASLDEAKALLERLEQEGWAADCVAFDIGEALSGSVSLDRLVVQDRKEVRGEAVGNYWKVIHRSGSLVALPVDSSVLENASFLHTVFENGMFETKTNFKQVKDNL